MLKFTALLLCVLAAWADAAHIVSRAKGGRIIGGALANAAQFPFATAIYKSTSTGTYFCTGTLTSNQWVLTAAQCVVESTIFTLRVGSTNLNSNDPNAQRLATDLYFAHPDYDDTTLQNDIALIKIRLPITFTDYIKPVSIIAPTTLPDYSSVVTYGWGQTSDAVAGVSEDLNYVYLTTLSNEECRLAYGNQVFDTTVCVDGNYNEGTCRGDLGSPLIQFGGSSLTYVVGVASFISSNGCESTDPSGFVRSATFVDWITSTSNNN